MKERIKELSIAYYERLKVSWISNLVTAVIAGAIGYFIKYISS